MNRNALTAGAAAVVLLGLAGCASGNGPRVQAPVPAVSALPPVAARNPGTVRILSGRLASEKYLGQIFRTTYTLRNSGRTTSDFLVTFEYLDRSGVRIGQSNALVAAMGPGRTARLSYDDLGSGEFSLKLIDSVRVAEIRSWPTV